MNQAIQALLEKHEQNPQLRIGQIIQWVAEKCSPTTGAWLFNVSDEELAKRIREEIR